VDDEYAQISAAQADEIKRCYEANARWVYGYARFLVGRDRRTHDARAVAEDLLQDTFVAAARAWETLRGLTEVQQRAWLRTTVSRMASNMGRRNQMFRDLMPEIYDMHLCVPPDPEEQAMSAVDIGMVLEKIAEVIDGLPFQQRMIAIMKWIEQMKNKEIAAELGTSPNVVAVQVNAIRRKLISSLGSRYPFATESEKDGTYDNG
jgi:RNA polymerase sigma factor (sigma-70 family)